MCEGSSNSQSLSTSPCNFPLVFLVSHVFHPLFLYVPIFCRVFVAHVGKCCRLTTTSRPPQQHRCYSPEGTARCSPHPGRMEDPSTSPARKIANQTNDFLDEEVEQMAKISKKITISQISKILFTLHKTAWRQTVAKQLEPMAPIASVRLLESA